MSRFRMRGIPVSDELRGTTLGGGDPISPSGVDVEAPTRYYMDHDGDGVMCLWLDYGPGDEFPVCLLREGSVAPELWDAAIRMLVVDDVSVYQVALAIHHATDALIEPGPFDDLREVRMMQARAAITAFGGVVPSTTYRGTYEDDRADVEGVRQFLGEGE